MLPRSISGLALFLVNVCTVFESRVILNVKRPREIYHIPHARPAYVVDNVVVAAAMLQTCVTTNYYLTCSQEIYYYILLIKDSLVV